MADNETANSPEEQDVNLEKKIARQVEYYFGDHNLRRDSFLKDVIGKDNGWLCLDTLLTFNRLKNLSTDKELIIKAIKNSPNQLLEVSENDEKVRRSPAKPLPELSGDVLKLEKEARSVYSKGFPLDATLDEITEFFDAFGIVENIYMKRYLNVNKFKGSVYTLFKSIEDAEKLLSQGEILFKGVALFKESSKQHREAKELAKRNKIQAKLAKAKIKTRPGAKCDDVPDEIIHGSVLYLSGLHKSISREDIKQSLDQHSKIAWIYFSRGETEGWVRFKESGGAKVILDYATLRLGDCVKIKNKIIPVRILEGAEEVEYWKKMIEIRKEVEMKQKKKQVVTGTAHSNARFRRCRWTERKHKREETAKSQKEKDSKIPKTDFDNKSRGQNCGDVKIVEKN